MENLARIPTHLSAAPTDQGWKLVAWHTSLDIAAYVTGGAFPCEVLHISGIAYADAYAVQTVVTLCGMGKREACRYIAKTYR